MSVEAAGDDSAHVLLADALALVGLAEGGEAVVGRNSVGEVAALEVVLQVDGHALVEPKGKHCWEGAGCAVGLREAQLREGAEEEQECGRF